MVAPVYETNLDDIALAEATSETTTNYAGSWTSYNGTGGSSLGAGADFATQGNNAIDMKITSSNGIRGPIFQRTSGSSMTVGASNDSVDRFFIWTYVATPGILTSPAGANSAGGTGAFFGASNNTNGAHYIFNLEDADSFGATARVGQCYAINPLGGPASLEGRVNGNYQDSIHNFVGSVASFVANSKGSNFATDAIRIGSGHTITEGDTNDPITYAKIAAWDNEISRRYGVVTAIGGKSFEQQGRVTIGTTATAGYFEDNSGSAITFKKLYQGTSVRDPRSFNRVIVGADSTFKKAGGSFTDSNAGSTNTNGEGTPIFLASGSSFNETGSTVEFTDVAFDGVAMFQVANYATLSMLRCSIDNVSESRRFSNFGVFQIDPTGTSVTLTDCNFKDTGRPGSGSAFIIGASSLDDITDVLTLQNCTFTGDLSAHAVNFGTVDTAKTIPWNNFHSGYTASDGAFANTVIKVNYIDTTNPLIISVGSGYDRPSVWNTGAGTVQVVEAQSTLTISNVIAGSDVVIKSKGTTTKLLDDQDITGTTSSYTYTYSAGTFVDIAVYAEGYVPFYINNFELGSSDQTQPVSQQADRNYIP